MSLPTVPRHSASHCAGKASVGFSIMTAVSPPGNVVPSHNWGRAPGKVLRAAIHTQGVEDLDEASQSMIGRQRFDVLLYPYRPTSVALAIMDLADAEISRPTSGLCWRPFPGG
jgi:hypothetical protein